MFEIVLLHIMSIDWFFMLTGVVGMLAYEYIKQRRK